MPATVSTDRFWWRAALQLSGNWVDVDLARERVGAGPSGGCSERAVAVDLLIREWGDPIVVRSQFYRIDTCDIFIAGDVYAPGVRFAARGAFAPRTSS